MDEMKELIINAVETLDEEAVLNYVQQAIEEGIDASEIINYVNTGMDKVGKLFESGQYFVADLMMSGIIFKEILEIDEFRPDEDNSLLNYKYTILLGTVFDDLHDIGKDIFGSMAKAAGFNVIDLGIDVHPNSFTEQIIRFKPDIVAMSGVLNVSLKNMAQVVAHIERAGLRKGIKIIVGGSPLTDKANEFIGADAFTTDASEGVEICKAWMKEQC